MDEYRNVEMYGVKRLYLVIPLPLFKDLQKYGYMGEIDEVVTRLLFEHVEKRKKRMQRQGVQK